MTDLIPFSYGDRPVRTVQVDGEPWFVAADVCAILGIADPKSSVRVLDDDEKGVHSMPTLGGQQDHLVVNEPGLYSLILRSRKPEAKAFKRWITHEVLPALRKTGTYSVSVPTTFAEALELAARQARQIEAAKSQVAELEPPAYSWERLASARGDYEVADGAKILARGGIKIGRDRLFDYMESIGWVYRNKRDRRWRAKQDPAVNRGWLFELPQSHDHPRNGERVVDPPQVRVTIKGIHELHKRLGGERPLMLGIPA